jgi:hypothetical protein
MVHLLNRTSCRRSCVSNRNNSFTLRSFSFFIRMTSLFVWVDLEMTGLDVYSDNIIEVYPTAEERWQL